MTLAASAQSQTWTYVDGDWYEGNVAILGPRSHAMWLGTSVFDGARWFEGVAPDLDLHSKRVNASAIALGLKPTMTVAEIVGLTWDGLKKFDGKTAVYIRPMYWAEHGGYMGVPAEPSSTRFCLCLYESPMIPSSGFSITVSPFRRPIARDHADQRQGRMSLSQQRPGDPRSKDARFRQRAGARYAGQCGGDRRPPISSLPMTGRW